MGRPAPPPIVEVYGGSGLCFVQFAMWRFVVKWLGENALAIFRSEDAC